MTKIDNKYTNKFVFWDFTLYLCSQKQFKTNVMKKIFLSIFILISLSSIGQTTTYVVDPDSAKSKSYDEATTLLITELNYYRSYHKLSECAINTKLSLHAYKWCRYIMNKHTSESNNFYKHSTFAPADSSDLVLPKNSDEIIHLVYWDHRPSAVEVVSALMYGVNRGEHSIIGWKQSPSHNVIMLGNYSYFGVSVFIAKRDKWWVTYGVVNYSKIQ